MRAGRIRGWPGMVALLALAFAAPAFAQTSRPEVTRIRIEGNRVFSDSELRAAIANRQTECTFLAPFCWVGWFKDRQYLRPDEVAVDALRLQAYYVVRGYRDAVVDTLLDRGDGSVELTFVVDEGQPVVVDALEINGLEELDVPGIEANLPLRVGDPLSAIELQAVTDTLAARLGEVGYADPFVLNGYFIPAGTYRAEVTFDIDAGPRARFGPVSVEWLPGVDGSVTRNLEEASIRRMVPFAEGDLFRPSRLIEGQRNLYSLELIRTASVRAVGDPAAPDTIIPIRIQLGEGDVHRVRTGGGWSTADCFSLEAQWGSRNFRGGARRLTVRGRVSNLLATELNSSVCPPQRTPGSDFLDPDGSLSVELVQPWVFSPRNSLAGNVFVERQRLGDAFVRQSYGVTLGLSRTLGRQATLTFSVQPAQTRLNAGDFIFCASFLLCTEDDINILRSPQWLVPLGLNLGLNRSNRVLNPTAGYSIAVDLESASEKLGSDFPYSRAIAEVTGYLGVGEESVLAARVQGGIITPGNVTLDVATQKRLSHPSKRFFSGGARSVRGFGENQLGPRILTVLERADIVGGLLAPGDTLPALCTPTTILDRSCDITGVSSTFVDGRSTGGDAMLEANLEFRFPLVVSYLQGAAFVDVGQVWGRDETGTLDFDASFEVTPGFGVRYFSPIGPVRLDVAYRPRAGEALQVFTRVLQACTPGAEGCGLSDDYPDWMVTPGLQRLDPRVALLTPRDHWYQKIQVHFSIGQAF